MHVLDTPTPVAAVAIYAAGYAGVVRYIGDPGNPRSATREELDDVAEYGLGMALVHVRDGADDWRGGYPAGHTSATMARSHASAIGYPDTRPLYFAVPHPMGVHEFTLARDYLTGVADALGTEHTGVYGSRDVVTMSRGTGVATYFWQHRDSPGLSAGVQLTQLGDTVVVGGAVCGVNMANWPDWGQHASATGTASLMVDAVIAAARHLPDAAVRRLATAYTSELSRRRTRASS